VLDAQDVALRKLLLLKPAKSTASHLPHASAAAAAAATAAAASR
jgi:hypothetical protein